MDNFWYSFVFLFGFALLFVVLQQLFPSVKGQRIWKEDTLLDLSYWAFNNFILVWPIKYVLIAFFGAAVYFQLGVVNGFSELKLLPNYIQIICIIIILDFTGYWMHRLFHLKKWWYFHQIHHSPKEIDFLSAIRFHPLENIAVIALQYLAASIFFGYNNMLIMPAMMIRGFYGYFVHANLSWNLGWFKYIFSSPVFHRWHHTTEKAGIDKNFGGVFSIWDFLFKTAYLPNNGVTQPYNFGVKDNVGSNIATQLLYPFKRIL